MGWEEAREPEGGELMGTTPGNTQRIAQPMLGANHATNATNATDGRVQDSVEILLIPDLPDPVDNSKSATPKITERDMLDALGRRYTQDSGNGDRWIRAEHVRNGTGFMGYDKLTGRCVAPLRTADFIAVDGWESKKHVIHGHEVKVSRSDWFTELRDPDKAEAFRPYCDYWWLVTSDPAVARREELPNGWGLMVLGGNGVLRVAKQARKIDRLPLPWPMTVGLARAIQKTSIRSTRRAVAS